MKKGKCPELIEAVGEYLRGKAFRQRSLGFNRSATDFEVTEVVTIQRGVRGLQGKFTIELGTYVPRVRALAHPDLPAPAFPQTMDCTYRERLPILAGWKDHWWESDRKKDVLEIEMLFERYGWPYLERRNSLERIFKLEIETFEKTENRQKSTFGTAVILHLAGRQDFAQIVVQEVCDGMKARGIATSAVRLLAGRLGIDIRN